MNSCLALSLFAIFSFIHLQCMHLHVEAADGFITTGGVHFLLNGSPFYANGFNAYWLMYMASDPSQRFKVSAAFRQASSHGLTIARTWAFNDGGYRALQYSPGFYNEQSFKSLLPAVQQKLPSAEHRYCFQYMYTNFKNQFQNRVYRDTMWNAARASTTFYFEIEMKNLHQINLDVNAYLRGTNSRYWARETKRRCVRTRYPAIRRRNFGGLDFVIAEARRNGIKLILSLVNNYESFGGKKQYVNWARNHGQYLSSEDDFFRNYLVKSFYKNHVRTVLNRYNSFTGIHYRDDPTIMAWELMNEPRCSSDPSGRTIQAWITEMASFVKSIDRNHLLEAGLEGFYGQSTPQRMRLNQGFNVGTDFIANNRISGVDFATLHCYPDQWLSSSNSQYQLTFLNNWLGTHIQDAQFMLGKPILLTEFGMSWKRSGYSSYQRDLLFSSVYDNIYLSARRGGAASGSLFWQLLTEGMDSFRDGYDVILTQNPSTANIIAQQSWKLSQIRRMFARMRNAQIWRRARAVRNRGGRIGS